MGAGKSPDEYRQWQRQVDGIEAYAGYLTPLHSFIYNQIYLGDAREVAPKLTTHYDLTLLIDMIEHLPLADGLKLLQELRRHSRNLLISTPKIAGVQGPLYGNNFERHISEWRPADFQSFADKVFIPNQASLICFIGEDVEVIRRLVAKKRAAEIRAAFRTLLPFLVRPYRRLKALVQRK